MVEWPRTVAFWFYSLVSNYIHLLIARCRCSTLLHRVSPDICKYLLKFELGSFCLFLCFSLMFLIIGKDIVDWLLHWAFVTARSEGAIACGELLEKAYLHPVGPLSRTSFKRKNARRIFCDNITALYRFVS